MHFLSWTLSALLAALVCASCAHIDTARGGVASISQMPSDCADMSATYPAPVVRCDGAAWPVCLQEYAAYWQTRLAAGTPYTSQDFLTGRKILYTCIASHEMTSSELALADILALELEHSALMQDCIRSLSELFTGDADADIAPFLSYTSALADFRKAHPGIVTPVLRSYETSQADILGLEFAKFFEGMGKMHPLVGKWTATEKDGIITLSQSIVLQRHDHKSYLNFHGLPAEAIVFINGVQQIRQIHGCYTSCRFALPSFSTLRGYLELSVSLPAKIPPSCIRQPWFSERL